MKRGDRGRPPALPAVPNAPFDAKQHWLDRVAHLPPQAWQQGGRAAPPKRAPVRALPSQPDLPATLPAVRHAPKSASQAASAASHRPGAVFEVPSRAAMRREPRAALAGEGVRVVRAETARTQVESGSTASPGAAPIVEAVTRPHAHMPLTIGDMGPRAEPTQIVWPPQRQSSSSPSLAATPSPRAAPRIFSDPREESRVTIVTSREPTHFKVPIVESRIAREPSPIAEFDMKRTRAPELPPLPSAQPTPPSRAAPMPRPTAPLDGKRVERGTPNDPNPPAHGWPDLPPWPAPRDSHAHTADLHARDRRRRLEHEQRG